MTTAALLDPLARHFTTAYAAPDGRAAVAPDLCLLRSDEAVAAFREGAGHASHDGDICLIRSRDGGDTWSTCHTTKRDALPYRDHRDPSILELRDGTLLLTFFLYGNRYTDLRRNGVTIVVMRSLDGGLTWPEERALPTFPFTWLQTTERCVELPDGRVLMPVFAGTTEGQQVVACYRSDDRGATWEYVSTLQALEWPEGSDWSMETSMTLAQSGRLVAVSRTARHMLQASSDDSGDTWREQRELTFGPPETQPSLNTLADGRLMLAYGDRGPIPRELMKAYRDHGPLPRDMTYPFAIKVHLSDDDGRTWGEAITLRDGFPIIDMGYPTTVELTPGQLLTIYWHTQPISAESHILRSAGQSRYFLECVRWTVPR